MDYRNRRYFLVEFHDATRNLRMKHIKDADPSAKFHPPYGHLGYGKYDGIGFAITGLSSPSCMLGCSKEMADAVLHELRKIPGEDYYSGYYELNPFLCRQ